MRSSPSKDLTWSDKSSFCDRRARSFWRNLLFNSLRCLTRSSAELLGSAGGSLPAAAAALLSPLGCGRRRSASARDPLLADFLCEMWSTDDLGGKSSELLFRGKSKEALGMSCGGAVAPQKKSWSQLSTLPRGGSSSAPPPAAPCSLWWCFLLFCLPVIASPCCTKQHCYLNHQHAGPSPQQITRTPNIVLKTTVCRFAQEV